MSSKPFKMRISLIVCFFIVLLLNGTNIPQPGFLALRARAANDELERLQIDNYLKLLQIEQNLKYYELSAKDMDKDSLSVSHFDY